MSNNELIYSKTIDKSLITEGFTLPLRILEDFFQWFPSLEIGQKQEIKLKLGGALYSANVINQPFNRKAFPTHAEMYQVRYSGASGFPQALRQTFSTSSTYLLGEHAKMREAKKNGGKQFSQSLNNDSTNLMIVCPNHHRIIHKCKPEFHPKKLKFEYPNGLHEPLRLNKHL